MTTLLLTILIMYQDQQVKPTLERSENLCVQLNSLYEQDFDFALTHTGTLPNIDYCF